MNPVSASLSETLSDKLAEALAEQIVSGRYAPGERLIEALIAKEFGVSHSPVRDALRALQNSGLVVIQSYRGAQVTALTVREVKEIYQVRAALVGLRARWIAEDNARHEFVDCVRAPIAMLATLAEDGDDDETYFAQARAVNRMFTENLSNRWLRTMLQSLTLQTSRYTRLALATPERRRESARLWKRLLAAIEAGDGDRAQHIASNISLATRDAAIRHLKSLEKGTVE